MHKFSTPNRFNSKTDKPIIALALFALDGQPSQASINAQSGEEDLLSPLAQDSKDNFRVSNFGGLVKITPFQVYRPGSDSQPMTQSSGQSQPIAPNSFPSNTDDSAPSNSGSDINNANQKSFGDASSPDSASPLNPPKGILKKGARTRYSQIGNFLPLQLGETGRRRFL